MVWKTSSTQSSRRRLRGWLLLGMLVAALISTEQGFAYQDDDNGTGQEVTTEESEVGPVASQLNGAEATEEDLAVKSGEGINILSLLMEGSWFMIPIVLMSLITVTFVVERFLGLRQNRVFPEELNVEVGKLADQFFDEQNHLKKNFFSSSNFRKISKSLMLNIIKTRIDEILELIKKQIFLSGFSSNITQNFFFIGGGSHLVNMDKYFSNFFQIEIRKIEKYGKNNNEDNLAENFSSCLGAFKLIKNGWETEAIPESIDGFSQKQGFLGKIFSIIK